MGRKPQTLAEFHFDKDRSGDVLRRWADESGCTRQELADRVGMSVHTLNNSLYGKVQDLSVDRIFKISVATGHSLGEYIGLMLEGESIDFADQLHAPDAILAKSTEDAARTAEVPDGLLDRFRRLYDTMLTQLRDQADTMRNQYQQQLDAMERQHAVRIADMESHHAEAMQRADKELERLQMQNARLRLFLILGSVTFGLMLLTDALIGTRGWFLRGLLDLGGKAGYITKG